MAHVFSRRTPERPLLKGNKQPRHPRIGSYRRLYWDRVHRLITKLSADMMLPQAGETGRHWGYG